MTKHALAYAPADNRIRRATRLGIFSAATPPLLVAIYLTDIVPLRFYNVLFALGFALSLVALAAGMISVWLNKRSAWGWIGVGLAILICGLQSLIAFLFV
jgi:hypothetical protein